MMFSEIRASGNVFSAGPRLVDDPVFASAAAGALRKGL
jgi:hypothetical protein